MANDPLPLSITRTWQDASCGTGESYYQTKDGTVWKTVQSTPAVTGVRYGKLSGGRVYPK